jgi:hypothetical protein
MDGFAVGRHRITRLRERGEYSCKEGRFHFSEALLQGCSLLLFSIKILLLLNEI